MTEPSTELLTTTEAAARAGVSERTMRKWVAAGKVSTHQTAEGPRVDRGSLDGYRRARAQKAANSGTEPGAALATAQRPDLGPVLFAALEHQSDQIAALVTEMVALRAMLTAQAAGAEPRADQGAEPAPEPQPEPEAEPGPEPSGWARWWRQWRIR